ncbi:MAG: hypothetical protein MUF71_19860 [Candidatus Kapabacteria bacterium]|jgi:hypothetical protein|nr:hypothetical protein [Candidatus Kapabacteria bacterium]
MYQSKTRYGVVAILDALGVAVKTIAQSQAFFADLDSILSTVKEKTRPINDNSKDDHEFAYRTFGDTIIFTWSWQRQREEDERNQQLKVMQITPIVGQYLSSFFCTALTKQILYRGSVSFGEFLISEDNNALIGPAIADAAHWYEKADWAGIIATPKMGFTLKSLQLYMATEEGKIPNSNFVLEKHFIESSVPLKDKSGKTVTEPEIWALAWFDEYHNNVKIHRQKQGQSEYKHHSKVWFTKDFGLCPITSGSESKYVNTAKFFMENIRQNVRLVSLFV